MYSAAQLSRAAIDREIYAAATSDSVTHLLFGKMHPTLTSSGRVPSRCAVIRHTQKHVASVYGACTPAIAALR